MARTVPIHFEEPPELPVETEDTLQTKWLESWELRAVSVAGLGRPAEGPIKSLFNLLAWHRFGIIEIPEIITEQWMRRQNHPIAPNNERRFLHTLQFIGLADAKGYPEYELWHMNRTDRQDPSTVYRELLRRGYQELEERLQGNPSWRTVRRWLCSRPHRSEQMLQRRYSFYQFLRLAMHTGALGHDSLMRQAQTVVWDSILPPLGSDGPKLIVVGPESPSIPLLKPSSCSPPPSAQGQLSFRFPARLEVVTGGRV